MLQKKLGSRYIITAVDEGSLVSAVSGASSCASRRETMVTVVCLLGSASVGEVVVVVFGGAASGRQKLVAQPSLRSQRKLSHGLNCAAPRNKALQTSGRRSALGAAKRRPATA